MIIPDVRIGDIVETAYTIVGSNPFWAGDLAVIKGCNGRRLLWR